MRSGSLLVCNAATGTRRSFNPAIRSSATSRSVPTSKKQSETAWPPINADSAERSTYLGDSTISSGCPVARQTALNLRARSALGQMSSGFQVMPAFAVREHRGSAS